MPRRQAENVRRTRRAPRRGRFEAVVELNVPVCREHYRLRLRVAGRFPASQPGQFFQLACRTPDSAMDIERLRGKSIAWPPQPQQPELRGAGALLRRPLSLAGRGEDRDGTWLETVYRVVGIGTQYLATLTPGAGVDLIGPLGHGFELPKGKHLGLLAGGGVGLPPMFYLAQALHAAGWDAVALVGATTRDLLAVEFVDGVEPDSTGGPRPCVAQFARYGFPAVVTTNDGTCGLRGLMTLGLERMLRRQSPREAKQTVLFTCGPEPMMRAAADLAAAHGVSCQVCMEQAMACGMGTCQSCVVKIADPQGERSPGSAERPWRYRLACTDGPVFDARTVVW